MKKHSIRKNVTLPVALNARAIRACKKEVRSFSSIIQVALMQYLDAYEAREQEQKRLDSILREEL